MNVIRSKIFVDSNIWLYLFLQDLEVRYAQNVIRLLLKTCKVV